MLPPIVAQLSVICELIPKRMSELNCQMSISSLNSRWILGITRVNATVKTRHLIITDFKSARSILGIFTIQVHTGLAMYKPCILHKSQRHSENQTPHHCRLYMWVLSQLSSSYWTQSNSKLRLTESESTEDTKLCSPFTRCTVKESIREQIFKIYTTYSEHLG